MSHIATVKTEVKSLHALKAACTRLGIGQPQFGTHRLFGGQTATGYAVSLPDWHYPVVFDLKNVDYISSAFLGICIMISKEVGRENFSIVNVNPAMKKVFKIAKLDTILNVS